MMGLLQHALPSITMPIILACITSSVTFGNGKMTGSAPTSTSTDQGKIRRGLTEEPVKQLKVGPTYVMTLTAIGTEYLLEVPIL